MRKLFWLLLLFSLLGNLFFLVVLDKAMHYRDTIRRIEDLDPWEGLRLTDSAAIRAVPLDPLVAVTGGGLVRYWYFSRNFPFPILCRGRDEESAADTLARFEKEVLDAGPEVVVVNVGFCDIHTAVHLKKPIDPVLEENLVCTDRMVTLAREKGMIPIVTTLNPVRAKYLLAYLQKIDYSSAGKDEENSAILRYNAMLRAYSREEGVALIDFHALLADGSGTLMRVYALTDGEHLNFRGYKLLSQALQGELARIYPDKTRENHGD